MGTIALAAHRASQDTQRAADLATALETALSAHRASQDTQRVADLTAAFDAHRAAQDTQRATDLTAAFDAHRAAQDTQRAADSAADRQATEHYSPAHLIAPNVAITTHADGVVHVNWCFITNMTSSDSLAIIRAASGSLLYLFMLVSAKTTVKIPAFKATSGLRFDTSVGNSLQVSYSSVEAPD